MEPRCRGRGGPLVVFTFRPALRKKWKECLELYLRLQKQRRGGDGGGEGKEPGKWVGLMESLNERPGSPP